MLILGDGTFPPTPTPAFPRELVRTLVVLLCKSRNPITAVYMAELVCKLLYAPWHKGTHGLPHHEWKVTGSGHQ